MKSGIKKAAVFGAVSLMAISVAHAQEEREFNIDAQALADSLIDFNDQSGVMVVAPREIVHDKTAPAVHGVMAPAKALEKLLNGSGLKYDKTRGGAYAITLAFADTSGAFQENAFTVAQVTQAAPPVDRISERRGDNDADATDTVVVTGSRTRRDDTFNSIAPLQTIDAETIRSAGFINPVDIITSQSVVNGVQPDALTDDRVPTASGPGSAAVSLRGLGAERTLVMVDGRRMAPAGIGGAPTTVDLNLLPSAIIGRVETLLDGAGSVYGSDAVAGVVNIILKDDFEGVRFEFSGSQPFDTGGETSLLSFVAGDAWDTGHFQFAAEYREQRPMRVRDRDYLLSDDGFYCPLDIETNSATGEVFKGCFGQSTGREFRTNSSPFGDGAEILSDISGTPTGFFGISNNTTQDYRSFPQDQDTNIINNSRTLSFFADAEQELTIGDWTTNVFVQGSWAHRDSSSRSSYHNQLFPTVSASNPTNPFERDVIPVISSPIERFNTDAKLSQARLLAGIRGDLGFVPGWEYEAFGSYSRADGELTGTILRTDLLGLSLNTTVDLGGGELVCGAGFTDDFGFLGSDGCVVVDLFAPSLYDPLNPSFATEEERDFLTGRRQTNTTNEQLLLGGYVTGPVFTIPGGEVSGVLGYEYRDDKVDTRLFSDLGRTGSDTKGSASLHEVYAEIVAPLVRNAPFAAAIDFEAAGRFISHEFYGEDFVYSLKGSWSPVDFVTFRGTYGTSFRAPNLRELFLAESSQGRDGVGDPCVVPLEARTGGAYDASLDLRDPQILINCVADGVDPTSLGLMGAGPFSEVTTGNQLLDPETSTAFTVGGVIQQPFSDRFDLRFGINYFDIDVQDSVNAASGAFILNECYTSTQFATEPFCAGVSRGADGFLDSVDATPFNIGFFNSVGIDYNIGGSIDFDAARRAWNLSFDATVTQQLERKEQNNDQVDIIDDVGSYGTPKWRAIANVNLETGPWSLFYRLRYIGSQENVNFEFSGFQDGRTADGILLSDLGADSIVTRVDDYFNHTISTRYQIDDSFSILFGIDNLLDTAPPLVDQDVDDLTFDYSVPLGVGYDLRGRRAFLNIIKEF